MMHGIGFPFFMGSPLIWLGVILGGIFLFRKFLNPHRQYKDTQSEQQNPRHLSDEGRLKADIFRLAKQYKGRITVSDVVTNLSIDPVKAEKILESLTDGLHVQIEVEENGVLYYIFPELKK